MRRYVVAICAAILITLRAVMPTVRIDEVSLALFAVLAVCILWPDISAGVPFIRKLRAGIFELELAERVEELGKKAEHVAETATPAVPDAVATDVSSRIAASVHDPRAALVLLAPEIEEAISRVAALKGVPKSPVVAQMAYMVQNGLVSDAVFSLFREFWKARNEVVHRSDVRLPSEQLYALVDVGITLLKVLRSYETPPSN